MFRKLASIGVVSLVLSACAAQKAQGVKVAAGKASGSKAEEKPKAKVVCHAEQEIGSHRMETICEPVEEQADGKQAARRQEVFLTMEPVPSGRYGN